MKNVHEKLKNVEQLINQNKLEHAEKELIEFIENTDPNSIEAVNNLSVVWIMQNRFEEALDLLGQILERNPNDEIALGNLNYINEIIDSSKLLTKEKQNNANCNLEVSIIIPVFNRKELTLQCLKSINSVEFKNNFEVIIVDNNSTDGTLNEITNLKQTLKYRLVIIKNAKNFGFAKANNIGVKHAKYDNLLFLNNDTVIHQDFLSKPVKILNSNRIGAVGIKLLYPDNLIQHAGLGFGKNKLATHLFNFYKSDYPPANVTREVSAITGACFFIKKNLFEDLGGFDEIYINGQEDIDLCMKIKRRGLKIWYTPEAWIYHLESQSANRLEKAFQNRKIFLSRWGNEIKQDINNYFNEILSYSSTSSYSSKFNIKQKINFAIKIGVPNREYKNWGDIYFAQSLSDSIKKLGHRSVVHYLNEWNQSDENIDVVIHIKGLSNYKLKDHNINIMWIINHPELHTISELNQYDLVFVASKKYFNQLKEKISVPIFYLPQATDHNYFNYKKDVKKEFDILFVGNNYEAKNKKCRKIVQDFINTNLEYNFYVVGENWENYVDPKNILSKFVKWEDLAELYSKAKIVLNDHQETMREFGFINNRTFDVAQTKSFQISDNVQGIDEFGIETYNTVEELKEKLDKYLNDRQLRENKSLENYEKTVLCNFNERAKEILAKIKELIKDKSGVRHCNICDYKGKKFLEMGVRKKVRCPICNSLERQRALWYLIQRDHIIEPGMKVLEIAPLNNKVFREKFEKNGCDYICIDKWKSGNPLDKRDTSWIDFEMDVCDLNFEDESFDLILMQHVIEEVPDDKKAFSEIARVLKKNGRAILEIPHDKWLRNTIEFGKPQKFGNVRQYGVDFYQKTSEFFSSQTEEIIDGVTFSIFRKVKEIRSLNFPVLLDHPGFKSDNFKYRFTSALELFNSRGFTSLTTAQVENLMYNKVFYKKPLWITLDDGNNKDISTAAPLLFSTNNVATSFLIVDKLNNHALADWKKANINRIIDKQNHSFSHKQCFVSSKVVDIVNSKTNLPNLLTDNVLEGSPIFEFASCLSSKGFIPYTEVIDYCIKFYKDYYNSFSHDIYIIKLTEELKKRFPSGLGNYESDTDFKERLEKEINLSNKFFSLKFNKEIYSFSFPWGIYNNTALEKAKEKHTLITRVKPSRVNHDFNPYEIDRIEIPASAYKELRKSLYRTHNWEQLEYKNNPKVSVLMTTFNRKDTLSDAIQSVVNQTYKDWDLIIVNDGGEEVKDIIGLFNDPRIKYFSIENQGKSGALNFAIKNSDSKYIAYLDDDDRYFPNHLEVLVTYLDAHKDIKFVYSIAEEVSVIENNYQWYESNRTIHYAKQVNSSMLRKMNHIPNLCAVHYRSLFHQAGLYDESLKVLIDWDMYRRLSLISEPKFINVVTAEYFRRIKPNNNAENQITGMFFTDPISYYKNRLKITSKRFPLKEKQNKNCIIIEINSKNKNDAIFLVAKYSNLKKMVDADMLIVINCNIDRNLLESIIYAERVGGFVIWNYKKLSAEELINESVNNSNYRHNIYIDNLKDFNLDNLIRGFGKNKKFIHFSKKFKKIFPDEFFDTNWNQLNNESKNKVSIIIPTYNNWKLTEKCIKSIYKAKNKTKFEVIVVDNNSSDETKNSLAKYTDKYSNIKIIFNKENLGFAKANNIGVSLAKYDLVLFLNNDTEPKFNWLDEMVKIISNKKVGIVGAKLIYPKTDIIQHAGVIISDKPHKIFPFHIFKNKPKDYPKTNFVQEYQAVTAACLLIKKDVFKIINGFDEQFKNGYEDIDLCFKTREIGFKVIYTPKAIVIHHESKSEGRFAWVEHNVKLLHKKWEGKIAKDNLEKIFRPKVSIIIPVFNQVDYTQKCIQSIKENTNVSYEIILINNGSTDMTKEFLEKCEYWQIINNIENLGYPKAVNQGIKQAAGEDIVLLNNDTIVTDGWLERLLKVKESDDIIGIIGVYSNSISGPQLDRKAKYKSIKEMYKYAASNYSSREYAWIQYPRVAFVCTLIKREVINKIGGLDERFTPGNFEDDDFCLRSQLAGFKTVIASDVFIHHYGSVSFKKNGENKYAERLEINKQKFIDKWGATPEEIWLQGKKHLNKEIKFPINNDLFIQSFERALININDEEYDLAIKNLKSALDNYEHSERKGYENISLSDVLNMAGTISLSKNQLEEAREYFEKELSSNPQSSPACFGLGEVFYKADMLEESKSMLEWAVINDADNKNAQIRLEEVNIKLNLPKGHNSVLIDAGTEKVEDA